MKNASEAAALIRTSYSRLQDYAVADIPDASLSLPDPLSTLLAVPIPSIHTPEGEKVQQAVEQAVRESMEQGIDKRGKEVTPWLLKRVGELSGGIALQLSKYIGDADGVEITKMGTKLISRRQAHRKQREGRCGSRGGISSTAAGVGRACTECQLLLPAFSSSHFAERRTGLRTVTVLDTRKL